MPHFVVITHYGYAGFMSISGLCYDRNDMDIV